MSLQAYAPPPRKGERTFVAFDPKIQVVVTGTYLDPEDSNGSPPDRLPVAVYLMKPRLVAEGSDMLGSVGLRFKRVGRADLVATGENCESCFAHTSACNSCGGHLTSDDLEEQ